MSDSNAVLILKVLDGLQARATVTAENIANARTPNYRPLRVSFEDSLKEAASQGDDAVRAVTIRATPAAPGDAESRVDLELARQSETSMRYGALIQLLNRTEQLTSEAVKGS